MEKVFEKSSTSPGGSTKLKNILRGRQKWQRADKPEPQYFPYGGGGDQSDELASQFNSYEPEELMVDSRVPIEEDSLHVWKRNARKILVRGSKYDIPRDLAPPNSRSSSLDTLPKTLPEHSSSTGSKAEGVPQPWGPAFWDRLEGICSLSAPQSLTQTVDFVRSIARATVVLQPLDALADLWTDSWVPVTVAAVELWLLMLAVNTAAGAVQILCRPAVWLLNLFFYIVK